MELTSAAANKMLKSYNERIAFLYQREYTNMTYTEVQGVKPEIPDYSFDETRQEIEELNRKVVILKHAINRFNTDTRLKKIDVSIDMALIQLGQLSTMKKRLEQMRNTEKRKIRSTFGQRATSGSVEYDVANFDKESVEKAYQKVCEDITTLQLELDLCNNTVTFMVDL